MRYTGAVHAEPVGLHPVHSGSHGLDLGHRLDLFRGVFPDLAQGFFIRDVTHMDIDAPGIGSGWLEPGMAIRQGRLGGPHSPRIRRVLIRGGFPKLDLGVPFSLEQHFFVREVNYLDFDGCGRGPGGDGGQGRANPGVAKWHRCSGRPAAVLIRRVPVVENAEHETQGRNFAGGTHGP